MNPKTIKISEENLRIILAKITTSVGYEEIFQEVSGIPIHLTAPWPSSRYIDAIVEILKEDSV